MRKELIADYVGQLLSIRGYVLPVVSSCELRTLYDAQDYIGMVRHIRNTFGLNRLRIRVGLVKSGGDPRTGAWVIGWEPMPLYGTHAFWQLLPDLYIRRSFIGRAPFESLVFVIAHEISHLILRGWHHPLRNEEEAADLTAMMFGYRDFYRAGCRYDAPLVIPASCSFLTRIEMHIHHYLFQCGYKIGYLSPREVQFAANIMDRMYRGQIQK